MPLYGISGGLLGTGSGALAGDAACCCGATTGCCCLNGVAHPEILTEGECSLFGGTWYAGELCTTYDCRCCDTVTLCRETVWGTFQSPCGEDARFFAPAVPPGGPGVVAYSDAFGLSCTSGRLALVPGDDPFSCLGCDGVLAENPGDQVQRQYYYIQYRSIANCSECTSTGTHPGNPPDPAGCYDGTAAELVIAGSSFLQFLCECNTAQGLCVDYTCEEFP